MSKQLTDPAANGSIPDLYPPGHYRVRITDHAILRVGGERAFWMEFQPLGRVKYPGNPAEVEPCERSRLVWQAFEFEGDEPDTSPSAVRRRMRAYCTAMKKF